MAAVVCATTRLTASLQAIAAALASPNEAALLEAEPLLTQAIDELRGVSSIERGDRPAVVQELGRARLAFERCRILGGTAASLVQAILAVHGDGHYDALGGAVSTPAPRGGQMKAKL